MDFLRSLIEMSQNLKKKMNIKNFKSHQETLEKVSSLSWPFRDDAHDDSITK